MVILRLASKQLLTVKPAPGVSVKDSVFHRVVDVSVAMGAINIGNQGFRACLQAPRKVGLRSRLGQTNRGGKEDGD